MNQVEFSFFVNASLYKIDGEYKSTKMALFTASANFAKAEVESIFSIKDFQLLIILDLEGHEVWRRIIVPSYISFEKLHFVIQIAFDWQSYHLHQFTIFNNEQPVALIANYEDTLSDHNREDFGYPALKDTQIMLEDYLPECHHLEYVYDFGDY